jgi:Ca2+-binding RTX toxin-like protein
MHGGEQDDVLWDDAGNDTLRGGQGADVFHFTLGSGQNIITDFNLADGDRILFSAGTVYSVADLGANILLTIGTDSITVIGMGTFNPEAVQFISSKQTNKQKRVPNGTLFYHSFL